jgi:hypothetical protein
MPDIARLDADGVIVAVETVSHPDHRDDPVARTVAIYAANHDLRERLGTMRYDWNRGCFMPVSAEPLDVAERETPGLIEGFVEGFEAVEQAGVDLPPKTKAAIAAWRRSFDGPRR